jgi:hypothetical protein
MSKSAMSEEESAQEQNDEGDEGFEMTEIPTVGRSLGLFGHKHSDWSSCSPSKTSYNL